MLDRDESLWGVLFHQTEDRLSTYVLSKHVYAYLGRQISNYQCINTSVFPVTLLVVFGNYQICNLTKQVDIRLLICTGSGNEGLQGHAFSAIGGTSSNCFLRIISALQFRLIKCALLQNRHFQSSALQITFTVHLILVTIAIICFPVCMINNRTSAQCKRN